MADIEFRVDAVLGDTSKLQQQLQNLKTNLTLKIDNKQALQAVKEVQQQINNLKQSMKDMNFGGFGGFGGRGGSSGGGGQNGGNNNATTASLTPETLASTEALYQKISNTVSGTVQQIQVLRNEQGQITSGTVTISDGVTTWKRNLEFVNGEYQRVIASGKDIIALHQTDLNKLGMDTGSILNTSGITDIQSLKSALSTTNIGWDDNTHSIKQFSQQVDNAGNTITKFTTRHKTIENGVEVWRDTSYAVSSADGKLRQYNQTQGQVLNTQQSLSTMLKSAIERFAVWGIAMRVWTGIGNAISDCTNYIIDLNTAMTNIRVVTMDTQEATEKLLETYNQLGQELGANTLDIAEGAVDWLRQGYSQADTTELVKNSTILSKLALIDNAQATEYLTSALKGYKLEAQDAIGVIDQLVSIDLEAATSAGDMAEAMSRTANMANTTGFEMNELLGMIATMSEVTQNSASTIGNSVKTILSRMSNVKAGVEDFDGESLNDVEKTLNRVGIALRDNQGNWYDFYDVLDEVASRWDTFSDVQQSQITTALGGTRQRENVLVALENWDKVKQYAETGANSTGTAMEKYDIVLESVSAKQEQLNAKVQEFYMNLVNSGLLTALLDVGQGFMDIMNLGDGAVGKILLLTTAMIGLNIVLNTLKGSKIALWFKNLGNTFTQLTAKTMTLSGALQALNINPVILGITALIAVVISAKAIFDHFNVTLEEQHEKAQQAQSDYQEIASELQSVNSELKTTQQRIAELEGKLSLTFVEEEELKKLKEINAELESQAYWLEKAETAKKTEVDEEASKAWDKDFNIADKDSRYKTTSHHDGSTSATKITENEYIQEQIRYLGELKTQIQNVENAEGEWANKTREQRETELERLRGLKTGVEQYLTDVGTRIQSDFLDSYDVSDDVKKSWLELQDIIRVAIDPDYTVKKFEEAIEDLPDKVKKNFKEADNAGNFKNLEEAFTVGGQIDSTALEKFKDALIAIGIEADNSSVLNYLNALSEATNNIEVTPLMSYSDIINDVKDKAEALAEAEIAMAESGYITSETVLELEKQFGDLSEYLTLTANGYLISKAGLDALNGSMLGQYQTALNEAKTGALNVLDQEHKKGLSYASTTEEIKKQLQAQLALAKANREKVFATASEEGYSRNEVFRSEKYNAQQQAFRDEEKAIENAIQSIDNAQKNYNIAKQSLNTIKAETISGGSKSGSKSSKTTKEWWETALEELKDNLEYDAITLDTYINGVQNILNKLKKGSDAWNEVNKELQKAKLDRVENQFDRGEITVDEYIKKLEELRKSYKKNTEGYKELTKTINDAKYDEFASQYERGEITIDQYIQKLKSLQKQYKEGSKEYKKIAKDIDDIKLEKTEQYIEKLKTKIEAIDQKINELGEVNTDKESVKYAELLSQKYKQVQKDIASIRTQLKNTNLTQKQREVLQQHLNDLLVDEVDIRDEIEDQVREYYENQREQAEQQAELNRKELLYQKELELYGEKGKELYEWETNQKIKAIEEQIELREAEKEALDEINEREQLENDLLEAKLKLQNALNNKTTKILKKQADGTWQYEYSANMADVKSAKEEIENAKQALEDFDFEQGIKELRDQADKLAQEMEELSDKYDEAEFWADREYEQTMNGIEKAYGDIDAMVEKWMQTYGGDITKLTEGYQSVVSANNKLEQSIINLTTAIESKYETVGTKNSSSKDGVKSFDTGGKIVGNGLILAHDKERVLTEQQNLYFESFVSKLPQLLKAFDITKFGGLGFKSFGSRVNADKVNSTIINKVECVFPNIASTDGLQKAILELPRLALQKK